MKKILVILLIIAFVPLSMNAKVDTKQPIDRTAFFNDVGNFIMENDQDFIVDYMLDAEGHPYIISVKSKNKMMTSIIKKMMNGSDAYESLEHQGWYIITFHYDQIQ